MQLTQKEMSLLKDLKGQEKLCADKYTKHAAAAKDPQLNALFDRLAGIEQQHYDTLTQMENGIAPMMNGGGTQAPPVFTSVYAAGDSPEKQNDCFLCSDVLAMEKHASHLYDTSIFEFQDAGMRSALNHIQKEEQGHGKQIYDYMAANNMYS